MEDMQMLETILYVSGFLLVTLLLQYSLFKLRGNHNQSNPIWAGPNTVIVICVMGLVLRKVVFLAAVIGYVIADDIGKRQHWHR